jgi:photosystem II stability/assembly factor-like uncharacterized protein
VGELGVGGTNGGIFKSVDGGTTWKPLTTGLPVVVQANLAISPANPKRLYATVAGYDKPGTSSDRGAAGIYRSDDAGDTWTRITTDRSRWTDWWRSADADCIRRIPTS